jgi:hypothetical protein
LAKEVRTVFIKEINNVQDLLDIGGLVYLRIPKREWAWSPGMRPFVLCQVEAWEGYAETRHWTVRLPSLIEDALLTAGWTRTEQGHYWEYRPPERGMDGL